MSRKIMLDMLTEENIQILQIKDIGFILTVIRDNCLNDETVDALSELIIKISYMDRLSRGGK